MSLAAARATAGPVVAEFFRDNLRHTKGPRAGAAFELEPWQQADVDLMYELDDRGRRVWRTIIYGIARGNGKSPICAGFGLLELVARTDSPDVFCAAASHDQATIVRGFAHDMPHGGPLEDYLDIPRSRTSAIRCPHNGGVMKVLSADGDLQHGLSVSVAIPDELHVWRTNKQEEVYFALATAMQKREDSVMFCPTTAGASKATLLGEKYDAILRTHDLEWSDDGCLLIARHREAASLMIWRGAPDGADVADRAVWRACNPASWIPLEELERMALDVPETVFRRLVLNQWVVGSDAAIQPGAWDACEGDAALRPGEDVWVGVDLGERRDTSGILTVAPGPGDRVRVQARVVAPSIRGDSSMPLIEAELRRIADTYTLRGVAFDPWQLRDLAQRLASEGMRMVEVPQNDGHMVPASQLLFEMVQRQQIVHSGDRVLRQHVLAAEAKQTSRGLWRIVKPLQAHGRRTDDSQKVDACIALALALNLWSEDNARPEPQPNIRYL